MKATIPTFFLTLAGATGVWGDLDWNRRATREAIDSHGDPGGSTATCTIVYYNFCSGWLWVYGCCAATDEIGVIFDLPNDCGKLPGQHCVNTGFWWYWRFTMPGYGITVSYNLYDVDASLCKVGSSIGTLGNQDPMERWNHYPGLGDTTSDRVAITVTWDAGGFPYFAADNNVKNQEASCGSVPATTHSVYYGSSSTQYCPPIPWVDRLGPVNILMDASFSCGSTATEPTAWGSIKKLFR